MAEDKAPPTWCVIGKSVRGASHVRGDIPNQDAIRWVPESGTEMPLILAVSDGHGSNKCFRSHVGAGFAVQTATRVLQELLDGQPDRDNLSAIKQTAEERLPQRLVLEWKKAVEADLIEKPFTPEEFSRLNEKDGPSACQAVRDNTALAYGATLLATLITNNFALYLQLGDGEILTVSEKGVVKKPLPNDERLIANETTSLCGPNAWMDFRVQFQRLFDSQPALILLSTDGYPNSFRSDDGFRKVGSDFLEMIRQEGLQKVESNLEIWLNEASRAGSGDDITVGIIKRTEAIDVDTPKRIKAQTDELETRLEGLEAAVKDATERSERIHDQLAKLRWGVVVASLLGALGILLASRVWFQSNGTHPRREAPTAPRTAAETLNLRDDQTAKTKAVEGVISKVGQRTITFQLERKGKVREEVVGVDDKTNIEKGGHNVKLRDLQETDKALINYEPDAYTPAKSVKVIGKGEIQKVDGDD